MEEQIFTPSYRRGFYLKVSCGLILVLSFSSLGLYFYLNRPFGGNYLLAIAELDRLKETISWAVAVSVTVQIVVLALLLYTASLFWTHKVAGPLYRLKMTFMRLADGDWAPMYQVRKGDQLKEIPGLLNRGLEAVESIDDEIKKELIEVENRVLELARGQVDSEVITATRSRLIHLLDKHWPI
ncbi:MAG: hypothetical protein U9Q39_03345 [Pseudomonadota bacterium]|nr:hypothetical protein [Pseudomonadota bacterium]